MTVASGIRRKIIGFHQDEEQHWVADLECGHTQHVRHDPPWQNRSWVIDEKKRASHIGRTLRCHVCWEDITKLLKTPPGMSGPGS